MVKSESLAMMIYPLEISNLYETRISNLMHDTTAREWRDRAELSSEIGYYIHSTRA